MIEKFTTRHVCLDVKVKRLNESFVQLKLSYTSGGEGEGIQCDPFRSSNFEFSTFDVLALFRPGVSNSVGQISDFLWNPGSILFKRCMDRKFNQKGTRIVFYYILIRLLRTTPEERNVINKKFSKFKNYHNIFKTSVSLAGKLEKLDRWWTGDSWFNQLQSMDMFYGLLGTIFTVVKIIS